jgi:hypothetical protein
MEKVQNPSKALDCCETETGEECKINCTDDDDYCGDDDDDDDDDEEEEEEEEEEEAMIFGVP